MSQAKIAPTTTAPVLRAVSSRRSLFGGTAAVVLGTGTTAGVAASAADLVGNDTPDAVLLAICAKAEEQDRLMHLSNDLQQEITRKRGRCPATEAARHQCNVHFDTFVDLAEKASVIPALIVAGMRAKARIMFLNMDTQLKPGGHCQVVRRRPATDGGRRLGSPAFHSPGYTPPDLEGGVASSTMLSGGEAVATELKVVVDAGVGGEKALGVTG